MLFKHEAPSLHDIEQRLLERFRVNAEPTIEYADSIDLFNLRIDPLVRINLKTRAKKTNCRFCLMTNRYIKPIMF